jgi:tRNA threonylcarbamoyl adenosine modification protein YeaZ
MMILALEFSSPRRSVALFNADADRGGTELVACASDHGNKDVKALQLIESTLANAGARRENVEAVAVGLGPGSYTGIRSALAIAQGWQLARDVKVAGISSVDALAWQAQASSWFGRVDFIIDAQRSELYLARFMISSQARDPLEQLRIVTLDEARALVERHPSRVAGPEAPRFFSKADVLFPEAAALGHLFSSADKHDAGEKLESIYLRQPNFVKAPPPKNIPA